MLRMEGKHCSGYAQAGTIQNMAVSNPTDIFLQQALHIFGEERLATSPSVQGLGILRLFLVLTCGEGFEKRVHGNNYRSFQAIYVEHLRIMVQEGRLTSSEMALFFMSQFGSDSFSSAISGQIPAFTDDDIEMYAPFAPVSGSSLSESISAAM